MPTVSAEQIQARKDEILDALENLMKSHSFRNISMQDIADATSFTRGSIYNYYQTREEIVLGLLKREYDSWNAALCELSPTESTPECVAEMICKSLEQRRFLLRLHSIGYRNIMEYIRTERLAEYQRSFYQAMEQIKALFYTAAPTASDADAIEFVHQFFTMLLGLDSMIIENDVLQNALHLSGIPERQHTIHSILGKFIIRFCKSIEGES